MVERQREGVGKAGNVDKIRMPITRAKAAEVSAMKAESCKVRAITEALGISVGPVQDTLEAPAAA